MPDARRWLTVLLVLVASCGIGAIAQVDPKRVTDPANLSPRVASILAKLTFDEKIAIIHGASEPPATYQGQAGWMPGVPRLGIPSLRFADGPHGVLTREISGAPPSTLALAATFSVEDARNVGVAVGRNARSRGVDVVLQPFINLYRDPAFPRSHNTYGEDPLLTGLIGAGLIRGIQAQGVMAQAKHFVAYEGGGEVNVGPQALHELYLAPFDSAVRAGVSSIMCSYNKVNGDYGCGNQRMLNDVLRGELGFKGFVTSDWGANHGAEFLARGLDLEMPGEVGPPMNALIPSYFINHAQPDRKPPSPEMMAMFFGGGTLPEEDGAKPPMPGATEQLAQGNSWTIEEALKRGTVNTAMVDRAVGRILTQMERFGLLDGKQEHAITPELVLQNAPIFERVASNGAVLLKNAGALPLKPDMLRDTVFIGAGALQNLAVVESGERALGWPARQIGPLPAVKARTGQSPHFAIADDLAGTTIPAAQFEGLTRISGGTSAPESTINFTSSNGKALGAGSHIVWSGSLRIEESGAHDLNLQVLGASGRLTVDGKTIGTTSPLALHGDVLQAGQDDVLPTPDGLDNVRRRVSLGAGLHKFEVRVDADNSSAPVQARFAWVTPAQRAATRSAAIGAAKAARAAVVFVWSRGKPDPFQLPGDQNALIADIAAVNPNTIVVLNTGGPVAMPWLSKVSSVLQMWYSGDEGGWAAADLLTGRISPSGRLPLTWPLRLADIVANDPNHPERSTEGVAGKTTYSEGLLIGYRWFDRQKIAPLFPFGYGLSYNRFDYSNLSAKRTSNGGLDVIITLRNAGPMAADEVPQVYLGAPANQPVGIDFADRALAGFVRVTLKSGETRRVKIQIDPRQLQYWSEAAHSWVAAPSGRSIWVGASSRDLKLSTTLR